MGCAHGKYSGNSPPSELQKVKMENGYVGKGGIPISRRSTGQRYSGRLYNSESPPRKINGGDIGTGRERKLSDARIERGVGGGGGGGGGDGRKDSQGALQVGEEEMVDGWPKWLVDNVPKAVLAGLVPKSAENYEKIDKVGQGTYSNVYKARDRDTGKIVALKKVRFDTSEPESVKFMAREIMILQRLDHPNVVKLEGLATSRMQYSLYLVFDFMLTDLQSIISRPETRLTESQIKCYVHQLLSGLQHCHDRGILHRDIKGSNLLIDKTGMLKIADFGLANFYSPKSKRPLTSRVVTLWYRAPELLLGATDYGAGIDLWSVGCLMAEMFAGRPIMPGRSEVEQLHRIFKLCGTPSEDYWKKMRLSTTFRPSQAYKSSIFETFGAFPESSLDLLTTFLALDPANRGSAASALQNEFFSTSPLACDLSGLPVIQVEEDVISQANEKRRHRNSKMKQRSRTVREWRRKDLVSEEQTKDSIDSKQELDKTTPETIVLSQDLGSSASSSNSSGIKARQVDNPVYLLSSPESSEQRMSPSKNIKNLPPLPASRTNNSKYMNDSYRFSHVQRSASTREFTRFDHKKHIEELYALED